MERLWAPWRLEYVLDDKPSGCIFCLEAGREQDRDNLVLHRTSSCFVMLNRYPYGYGHLLVAPLRHVPDLDVLPPSELHDLIDLVNRSVQVLKECVEPEGLNVGMNLGSAAGAGVAGHLHVHVIPRWVGDTNFVAVIGDVRVMPENLRSSYDRLFPGFNPGNDGCSP